MATQTEITPIFAIPPRSPELHWDLIGRLRAELEPLEGVAAAVWIHPADPNLSTEPGALPEKGRQVRQEGAPGERFALTGYAGAPLSALTDEEMKRELQWAERNPWGAAARAHELDRHGAFRSPTLVDPARPPLGEAETTFLATFEKDRFDHLLYSEGGDLYSLPLLRLSRHGVESRGFPRDLGRFLRQCRKSELPGLLLMEVDSTPGGVSLLREAIATISAGRLLSKRINLAPFPLRAGKPETLELLTASLSKSPIAGSPFARTLHRGLRQAAAHRALPGANRERRRMVLTAFREEQPAEKRNHTYGERRVYTAAMHGSAELVGDTFSTRTEEGRPALIVTPSATLGIGEGATTTVRFPSSLSKAPLETCSVESVTAFSFEAPLSRGIREESAIGGRLTGRSRLDSYFLTDYEELFLALDLTISGSIDEDLILTPVEYGLARLRKDATTTLTTRRTVQKERTLRDSFSLEPNTAIPIFASELTVEDSESCPGFHCGSADLWRGAVVPMALAMVPGVGRRGGAKIVFAPFGMIRIPKGEIRHMTLRRTVRIAPISVTSSLPRLSRDLEEELLLWEGKEA